MIKANLPMYDWPETQADLDQFWLTFHSAMNEHGYEIADALDREAGESIWLDDQLGLSQTCGFPLVHQLPDTIRLLGTPTYNTAYFADGLYASVVLARRCDKRSQLHQFEQSTVAINSTVSQSGFNALRNLLAEQHCIDENKAGFFSQAYMSGSHRVSMQAVADKRADICAIDPVTFALAKTYDASTAELKIIDCTASSPGLPLICSPTLFNASTDFEQWKKTIQAAWRHAAATPAGKKLRLDNIIDIPRNAYEAVPRLEAMSIVTQ